MQQAVIRQSLAAVVMILVALGSAHAQPAPAAPDAEAPAAAEAPAPAAAEEPPWSRGVPPEQRERAQKLLEEGNDLFLQSRHREALDRYQQAVAVWDHPAIRFNIVRALIQLERLVEAYDNLELALRHGSAPLEDQIYAEAQAYQRLLRGRIAELEVTCLQAGVAVTLDGRAFLTGADRRRTRLLPGNHQIVAKKPGYLTVTRDIVVMPGANQAIDIHLPSLEEATITTRRWALWKPWAVVGAGVALGGLGILLELESDRDLEQYAAELENRCRDRPCHLEDLPRSTRDLADTARLEHKLAIGSLVAGGTVAVAGVAMVVLNRSKAVLPDQPTAQAVSIAPVVAPGTIGASLSARF